MRIRNTAHAYGWVARGAHWTSVSILAAIFIWWLLYRSTIGFEFRAVGANPDGARYAGMNVLLLYVGVMAVAGAMATAWINANRLTSPMIQYLS